MSRILVAGSEILDRPESRIILEAKGYQIITSSNLQHAISFFLEDPADLLVLEKGFADNGHLDLIRVVKACLQKANIPILLVVSKEEMIAGLNWGLLPVDDLLTRPVSPEILLTRVQLAEARMNRVFDNIGDAGINASSTICCPGMPLRKCPEQIFLAENPLPAFKMGER